MTGIITEKDLFSKLDGKNILLDTCCLIHATKQPELIGKLLRDIKSSGASLFTIPIINLEFLRDVGTIEDFKKRQIFLNEITEGMVFPVETKLNDIPEFPMVMKNVHAKTSLADYLLVASLVIHHDVLLMTENHQDMPLGILDRISIMSFDNNNGIKTFGLYQINSDKYIRSVEKILGELVE